LEKVWRFEMKKRIDAAKMDFNILNKTLRAAIDDGYDDIEINNVCGQRFICAGLEKNITVRITGIPGNDLGAFLSAGTIIVNGNVQDGCGNTMNGGRIIVNGNAGDILGHSMKGGEIYVKKNAGYRIGIHMKAYENDFPVVVIGGSCGAFLGEYQAGGMIIVLKIFDNPFVDTFFTGTGMHGGKIFIRGSFKEKNPGKEVRTRVASFEEMAFIKQYVEKFGSFFVVPSNLLDDEFTVIFPYSHRPYGRIYSY